MWALVYCVASLGPILGGLADYADEDGFYSYYDEGVITTPPPGPGRARPCRQDPVTVKTLNPQEIEEVKGALKEIMGGRDIDRDIFFSDDTYLEKNEDDMGIEGDHNTNITQESKIQKTTYNSEIEEKTHTQHTSTETRDEINRITPVHQLVRTEYDSITLMRSTQYDSATPLLVRTEYDSVTSLLVPTEYDSVTPLIETEFDGFTPLTNKYEKVIPTYDYDSRTLTTELPNTIQWETKNVMEVQFQNPTIVVPETVFSKMSSRNLGYVLRQTDVPALDDYPTTTTLTTSTSTATETGTSMTDTPTTHTSTTDTSTANKALRTQHTNMTSTKRSTFQFNVEKFLELVANLTYDYDTDLVHKLNKTFIDKKVPTCGLPTETEPPPEIGIDYSALSHTVSSKCFVCGLTTHGVPYDANCADAFSNEFIPILKVNTRAKQYVTTYRKSCRYMDIDNFYMNRSMPRSIFGRWTGGCSVRWTDLSGIYTQRSCRNRHHAATGRHYASKRMAKLEMSLKHLENGCIISPVASLIPLSRGISLFARFHACVCTGSFCNGAIRHFDIDIRLTFMSAVLTILSWIDDVR